MLVSIRLTAGVLLSFTLCAILQADDAEEIKKLAPAASSMARKDFETLAKATTAPKASDVEEKTLTLMLFSARLRDDAKAQEQFRFLTKGYPKPAQLAGEMNRTLNIAGTRLPLGLITMIQADRITDITCDVKDETATGVISFEVPKLYAGKVEYVARKNEGKWRIEEFHMPAYEIHVTLGKKGKWEQK